MDKERDTRSELIELVTKILGNDFETEEEDLAALSQLEALVPDPHVTDYIYYWDQRGFDSEPTAEEIVDRALSYKPFAL